MDKPQNELQEAFEKALNSTDAGLVFRVAKQLDNVAGWEKETQTLYAQSALLSNEEWSYDRSINN